MKQLKIVWIDENQHLLPKKSKMEMIESENFQGEETMGMCYICVRVIWSVLQLFMKRVNVKVALSEGTILLKTLKNKL